MKLYYYAPSHHSRRVLALINQLGLEVELIQLLLPKGEHRTEEIRSLNPTYNLPILVDGDFTLWESNAIMQYLCDQYAGESVYSTAPRERALINQWLSWQMCHLAPPTNSYMFQRLIKPLLKLGEPDENKLEEAREDLLQHAGILEEQLAGNGFVCGNALSIADFAIASCFMYAEPAGMPWDRFGQLQAWFGRIQALPAWPACESG